MPLKKNNELIFGLVAPLGVELLPVTQAIESVLENCAYKPVRISLSEFLREDTNLFEGGTPTDLAEYVEKHQKAGNEFRKQMGRNDAMALGALRRIHARRKLLKETGEATERIAFIVRQFKTPAEIQLIRKVYGDRFILVGVHANFIQRIEWLSADIEKSRGRDGKNWTASAGDATPLIQNDEAEETDHGQNARDTFPLADVFTKWAGTKAESILPREKRFETQFEQFVYALLGCPESVPTTEETLMREARTAALCSADWSRQVGAVIATRRGSVIAVGRNDEPKVGGGVVSKRDQENLAAKLKEQTVREVLLCIEDWIRPEIFEKGLTKLTQEATQEKLKSTRLMGLGEFGRPVHAEMAAITDAAARGVAVSGNIMFCTTFPCQNCAKHVMAAGITALVYLDPYPKSLVLEMYGKETVQPPMEPLASEEFGRNLEAHAGKQLLLLTYMGVAPHRYDQLFAMSTRKDSSGNQIKWDPKIAEPKLVSKIESDEYFSWEISESQALNPFLIGSNGIQP